MGEAKMRCDRCAYWEPPTYSTDFGFGHCSRTPHSEDMGHWNYENGAEWVVLPEFSDRTACARDGSGWHASLSTKPEHFCAMFREKSDD